jgi:hypothetical protein
MYNTEHEQTQYEYTLHIPEKREARELSHYRATGTRGALLKHIEHNAWTCANYA